MERETQTRKEWSCPACKKSLEFTEAEFLQHIQGCTINKVKRDEREKKYKCTIAGCAFRASCQSELNKHMEVENKRRGSKGEMSKNVSSTVSSPQTPSEKNISPPINENIIPLTPGSEDLFESEE